MANTRSVSVAELPSEVEQVLETIRQRDMVVIEREGHPEAALVDIVDFREDANTFAGRLPDRLGRGERSALGVAYYRNGLFASDDADARREARVHEVPVTGTIGVLTRLVRRKVISIDQGNDLLAEKIDAGFYAPVESLEDLR